ncbi:MAG: serine hydrolase, partial [Allomuricauda sp.]
MKVIRLFALTVIILVNSATAQQNGGKTTIPKNSVSFVSSQIQVVPIKDTNTEKNYELYIEVPEDYAENTSKTYPVI